MAYSRRARATRRTSRPARRSYAGSRPASRRAARPRRSSRRSAQVVRLVVESAPSTQIQRPFDGQVQALMPVGLKRSLV